MLDRVFVLTAAVTVSACIGTIGGSDDGPASGGGPSATTAPAGLEVEPALVRKLNRREYTNTLRDLLGAAVDTSGIPADAIVGFDNLAESLVASKAHVEQNLGIAETAIAKFEVGCGDDACVAALIKTFGRRAFRRPLTSEEAEIMAALFSTARAAGRTIGDATRLVLQALLQSPQFLYRLETSASEGGGVQRVSKFELASRLSYFLWASMPDDELLDAAEQGKLESDPQVEAQVRRMLGSSRAKDMVEDFHALWLQLYKLENTRKDAIAFPTYEALRPSLRRETLQFTSNVFWEGRAADLLLADYTFADAAVATHYGVSGTGRVSLAGTERRGLLGQGSILSMFSNPDRTSPTLRGRFVREQLLCQPPPPPPPGIPALPSGPAKGSTIRERLAEHTSNPSCMGCHNLIDPPGFGLESFDTTGAFRIKDGDNPVDNSGELRAVSGDAAGYFRGEIELSQRLARAPEFTDCVARQWFRFAFGRREGDADRRTVDTLVESFRKSNGDLRELIVTIATSPAFRAIATAKSSGDSQ